MARARFIAPGHGGQTCKVFKKDFPHGDWVSVDDMDPKELESLAQNPTFEVEGFDAPKPKAKRGAKAPAGDPDADSSAGGGDNA